MILFHSATDMEQIRTMIILTFKLCSKDIGRNGISDFNTTNKVVNYFEYPICPIYSLKN